MTQIVDYTSLQAAVTEYLARDQDTTLIARIPTFIQLAEAKFNRQLFVRQMEQRSTALVDTGIERAGVHLAAGRFPVDAPGSPVQRDRQAVSGVQVRNADGRVSFRHQRCRRTAALFHGVRRRDRIGADTGPELHGRDGLPAEHSLARRERDNWLLTLAPDLYLYGALLESAPYIKEDGRIQTWGLGFTSALGDLNNLGLTSTFNAGPMTVRVSGQVF